MCNGLPTREMRICSPKRSVLGEEEEGQTLLDQKQLKSLPSAAWYLYILVWLGRVFWLFFCGFVCLLLLWFCWVLVLVFFFVGGFSLLLYPLLIINFSITFLITLDFHDFSKLRNGGVSCFFICW